MENSQLTPKIQVRNVSNVPDYRSRYKYVIIREAEGEYWFYNFSNNLYHASKVARLLGNGFVIEVENMLL